MEKITREQFVDCLNRQWQALVGRFQRLSVQEQAAYLKQQGYATFGSLLGHIIAWWQDGAQVVEAMRADAAMALPDYNVDEFNARAVARFGLLDEAEVLNEYEAQRKMMLRLVNDLSDAELQRGNINKRLYYEIIMHWSEHMLE